MAHRKLTLRRMPEIARRHARLTDELDSVHRRLKNETETISRLELDSKALAHARGRVEDVPIFVLTKADVLAYALGMGISAETITDAVLDSVKKGVESRLAPLDEFLNAAINFALKS